MTVDNATFDVSFVMHFFGKMKRTKRGNTESCQGGKLILPPIHTPPPFISKYMERTVLL